MRRELLELTDRGVPRAGYPILQDGESVGELTSGAMAPTLGKPIGMGYMSAGAMTPGSVVAIEIRGKQIPAVIVPLPFYKRAR